jgi:hypothetical protein
MARAAIVRAEAENKTTPLLGGVAGEILLGYVISLEPIPRRERPISVGAVIKVLRHRSCPECR